MTKFQVEKFNGKENVNLWQKKVKAFLVQQGVHKTLQENSAKPVGTSDGDWGYESESSKHNLILSPDEVMFNVMDEEMTTSLWSRLETLYMTKSLSGKLYLKKQLYGLRMIEGTTELEHLNFFNKVISELLAVDVKIDEEDTVLILLSSLLESYNHIVTIMLYGKKTLILEEFM